MSLVSAIMLNLRDLLVWGTVSFLAGVIIYIGVPILAGPSLPPEYRKRISNMYFKHALAALDRALLIRRQHGGYDLVATSYDAEKKAEKVKLGGETKHYKDHAGLMSRLYNKPFGVAQEGPDAIVTPAVAEAGEFARQHKDETRHTTTENGKRKFARCFPIPDHTRLVDIKHAAKALPGSAKDDYGETAEDYTEKSQKKFSKRDVIEVMSLVMAYGAGVVIYWGLKTQAPGASGGGGAPDTTVPVMIDVLGVVL